MGIFGDESSMVERAVEIDARVFLEGMFTSRWGFQLTGPGTRGFPEISLRSRVLTQGLSTICDLCYISFIRKKTHKRRGIFCLLLAGSFRS